MSAFLVALMCKQRDAFTAHSFLWLKVWQKCHDYALNNRKYYHKQNICLSVWHIFHLHSFYFLSCFSISKICFVLYCRLPPLGLSNFLAVYLLVILYVFQFIYLFICLFIYSHICPMFRFLGMFVIFNPLTYGLFADPYF